MGRHIRYLPLLYDYKRPKGEVRRGRNRIWNSRCLQWGVVSMFGLLPKGPN